MAPKRRLEDDHDDTPGHSMTDRPPAKKNTSTVILKVRPERLRALDVLALTNAVNKAWDAATTSASTSTASDVTEELEITTADTGLDITPTHEPRRRVMNKWSPREIAFLTLVYRKLALARSRDDSFIITNDQVYEAYERHYGADHRDRKSMYMRLLRKDGNVLNNLYQLHGSGKVTAGNKLYRQLNITQEELDAYVADGYVSIIFTAARYAKRNQNLQVESDAAKSSSQPASITATEDAISSPPNSPIADNLTENLETQEPRAEPSEIRQDTKYLVDIETRSLIPLATTVDDSTQKEPNWAPDTWSTDRRATFEEEYTFEEQQAALALVELSRSTDLR